MHALRLPNPLGVRSVGDLHQQARLQLVRDGTGNMEVLCAIERSLFVVCLDDARPASLDDVRLRQWSCIPVGTIPTAACTYSAECGKIAVCSDSPRRPRPQSLVRQGMCMHTGSCCCADVLADAIVGPVQLHCCGRLVHFFGGHRQRPRRLERRGTIVNCHGGFLSTVH